MGKQKNTVDLTTLSHEELLAFALEAQAKVAELEKTVEDGVTTIEAAEKKVADLSEVITKLEARVNEAIAEGQRQTETNAKLQKELDTLLDTNAELQLALESKPTSTGLPEIKHGGKVYLVAIPKFSHNGIKKSTKDLMSDSELVKELVEIKSGVLKLKA